MIQSQTILDKISCPKDLKAISESDLHLVCSQIREIIIKVMSINPGHLGASMGAVELSVGIHYVFNSPVDVLVWDVGHQAYAHKILTGRYQKFESIRQKNGISGFPKKSESEHDHFGTGHSSTSISAVLGMAIAKMQDNNNTQNIAVIGDGSLTGGMSFEALNHLATTKANVLVIINDNEMSIDPNVGGLQNHLNNINPKNNYFTNLGLAYFGPFEGNQIDEVVEKLKAQNKLVGPRVIHFKTQKGFGYNPSQSGNATHWHAPGKFDIETGNATSGTSNFPKTYQHIVGNALCELAENNKNIFVVTPAMASGSKLKNFEAQFPNQFFDVGIAEQHAVTFAGGLANIGKIPFCVIYSTFLQRGYDQLIHDIALQHLKVIFLIDRAGLVGNDGATHHGAFDLAFLNCIPNMTIYAPANEEALYNLIHQIPENISGPVAIRYPRGNGVLFEDVKRKVEKSESVITFSKVGQNAVISIGSINEEVSKAITLLKSKNIDLGHYALQIVKPLPIKDLSSIFEKHDKIFIVEDGTKIGGISTSILMWKNENKLSNEIEIIAFPDMFIEHGTQEELYESIGMNAESLTNKFQ